MSWAVPPVTQPPHEKPTTSVAAMEPAQAQASIAFDGCSPSQRWPMLRLSFCLITLSLYGWRVRRRCKP